MEIGVLDMLWTFIRYQVASCQMKDMTPNEPKLANGFFR